MVADLTKDPDDFEKYGTFTDAPNVVEVDQEMDDYDTQEEEFDLKEDGMNSSVFTDDSLEAIKSLNNELVNLRKEIHELRNQIVAINDFKASSVGSSLVDTSLTDDTSNNQSGFFDDPEEDSITLTFDELDDLDTLVDGEDSGEPKDSDNPLNFDEELSLTEDSNFDEEDDFCLIGDGFGKIGTSSDDVPPPYEQSSKSDDDIDNELVFDFSNFDDSSEDINTDLESIIDDVTQIKEDLDKAPEELNTDISSLDFDDSQDDLDELMDDKITIDDMNMLSSSSDNIELEGFYDDNLLNTDSFDDSPDDIEIDKPSEFKGDITPELINDVKSVLSYMDELLESLPSDKIKEFADSKHYSVYKKIFHELEIEE